MKANALAVAALVVLASAPAGAQKPEDIVKWTAKAPAAAVKPGGESTIELSAAIESGWYMYALVQPEGGAPPLDIALAKGQPFSLDAQQIGAPAAETVKGSGSEPDVLVYKHKAAFKVPVTVPNAAKPGRHTVTIEATYQVCSGSICLRATRATLPVAVTVK
jgi:hypothetical protein